MKKIVDKILDVQTVFFIFLILFCLATLSSPLTSSARFVTSAFGTPNVAIGFLIVSALAGIIGLIFSRSPIHYWLASLPFLSYCCLVLASLWLTAPPLSASAVITFAFIIWLMMSITWGKINE